MGYILRVETGPGSGQDFYLTGASVTIGRELGNEVLLTDSKLSRCHVRLNLEGIEVIAIDLGSANGTRVNGRRISGPHPLYVGDLIQVGESSLRLLTAPGE
jgi:pSer/pThr/pTyr-binding forkhead associated (FHA) protein